MAWYNDLRLIRTLYVTSWYGWGQHVYVTELNSPGTPSSSHCTLGEYSDKSADGLWQNKGTYSDMSFITRQELVWETTYDKQARSSGTSVYDSQKLVTMSSSLFNKTSTELNWKKSSSCIPWVFAVLCNLKRKAMTTKLWRADYTKAQETRFGIIRGLRTIFNCYRLGIISLGRYVPPSWVQFQIRHKSRSRISAHSSVDQKDNSPHVSGSYSLWLSVRLGSPNPRV